MSHKESQLKWYQKNREKVRQSARVWYTKNKKRLRKYHTDWVAKPVNKEKKRLAFKAYRLRLRMKVVELLGGKCKRCGFEDARALQVDHINGNGRNEKLSVTKMYSKHIIDSIVNKEGRYQLLCANCNWIKRTENNETGGRPKTVHNRLREV